ncbi:hypothetical protein AB6A40_008525 [Gnathostoma spinigerum]|uniref:FAM69 protein-kinase domain-containing protein n=1 Tax=Gnathostoma spinigerum TaxID=75299 RepID=A0ABD6EPQ4_9BILA
MFFISIITSLFCFFLPFSVAERLSIDPKFNRSEAESILRNLCKAYDEDRVSGDLCNRLCYHKEQNVIDYYRGNKVVIIISKGGQKMVLKSLHPYIDDFDELDPHVNEENFTDAMLETVNYNLRLGWPHHYKNHLVETVWPTYIRKHHQPLSEADRRSIWSLLNQDEFTTFRIIPLSRVTPKIVGTCGHFYQVEHLVPFKMKTYYKNLKAKILVHLMGTLKLLDIFLNEPLHWCDAKFDNLGLAAEYPKRFMIMDGDMLYTSSRLNSMLVKRMCKNDEDCNFFDCRSNCNNVTHHCTARTDTNLEVFCKKFVTTLFGDYWTASNRYLSACHQDKVPIEKRMNELRLVWAWSLSEV